jgi:X-Pro dipeptidyl-peptidase
MNLRWATGLALAALSAVAISTLAPITALADPGDGLSIVDGVTAPAFSYTDAIRERVYIPVAGVDQDQDGHDDTTVIDIIRPAESDGTLKVPAIIDPSPYYTTIGRGNENEKIADLDHDGLNDVWPTFYDNYFVPRGYAVILAHMDGTGFSDGCPMHGGPGDIESMKVVVDWLQGRVAGHDAANHPVVADWDNGKAAMIGKSYDGTLANGVAATGVVGLTTIVPIDAISDWYRYSRTGGVRFSSTNYPAGLARTVTNDDRRDLCATTRDMLNLMDGDETGDVNAFWQARDYLLNVDKVTASVFAVHGLNDDNVMMDQLGPYWDALTQRDIPRKLWLAKTGHVDPFDYRREVWVDTLHRWFDYWLQGVDNGIMDEPMATVENAPDVFEDYANWPIPGTQDVDVYLAGETGVAGSLALQPSTTPTEATFTGAGSPYNESALMGDRDIVKNGRLVFLSEPLQTDLRLSGTPRIELTASLDKTYSNLTALLVDYGTSTRTTRSGEGIHDLTTSTCWGEASTHDDACYLEVAHTLVSSTTDTWRVTRGTLDSRNRDSLVEGAASDVVPGDDYGFSWPLEPYDQVFAAGHRIGVVLTTNLSGYQSSPAASVTVDTAVSRIVLPVVGGLAAADHSAAFGAAAPVALSFDLGGHGTAIPDQAVAYDTAPVEPTVPTEAGWVFQGWYTDATHSTAFDFDAELTSDATAFAAWASLEDVVDTLQIVASDLTVKQGKSITVSVEGFDASGGSLGDVTDFADLTSSVDSDVILGNKITFVHASPHVITATLGGASAAVTVEVSPPVVNPAELGSTGADFAESFALLALLLFVTGGLFLLGRRLHRRA